MFILATLKNPNGLFLFKIKDVNKAIYLENKVEVHIGHVIYDLDMDLDGFLKLVEAIDEADLD